MTVNGKRVEYWWNMVAAIENQLYSLEEYFELELQSEERLEFWNGHVWSMAGASPIHERIVSNAIFHLRTLLGRRCSVLGSNLRVNVPAYGPYRYPDLSVFCGEGIYKKIGGIDALTNPEVLIEVLSPKTESFDRGDKFILYKSIPSLKEYLLISTTRPSIVQLIKGTDNDWIQRDASGFEARLQLPSMNVELLLSDIFLDIKFPDPKSDLFLVAQ